MIPVIVDNLSISKVGFVVLLKSQNLGDERTLPIYIGPPEAQAILFHLNDVSLPRPMTHDLLKSVLDAFEARLERIEICNLQDGTFRGQLVLSFEGQTFAVDSRPSDAIALALRCAASIYVAAAVMDEAGVVISSETEDEPREPVEEDPVAKLKTELAEAVKDERYEDAARLRDEINHTAAAN